MTRHERDCPPLFRAWRIRVFTIAAGARTPARLFRILDAQGSIRQSAWRWTFSGLDQFEVSLTEPRVLSIAGDDAAAAGWWMAALPASSRLHWCARRASCFMRRTVLEIGTVDHGKYRMKSSRVFGVFLGFFISPLKSFCHR